ncbi:DedA family protein [Sphingomonas sp. KR1UV-12]|uniref:DedA family protein n=1 Tax=Sphingomonas aurea TaxID=3063994 RepID=A0ABT9EM43_9SPHN|nr:DedA family protein [Sphingomonas sp. KR1UV-12]MDP1028011.1 DedA family protein [Sphingomonas sp. KR1UV-12]
MTVESILSQYGLIALFFGAGLEGETVVVTGGVLAHRGIVPLPAAMAVAVAGSFVADQLFFLLGRRYRQHPRVQRIMARPAFARALATFERHPTVFILGFRFLYGVRTISPIAIGTTSVAQRRFMALNAVAATVWGVGFTSVGYWFGSGFDALVDRYRPSGTTLILTAAALAAAVLAVGQLRRWRRSA